MLNHYRIILGWFAFVIAVLTSVGILFTPASGVPTAPPGTDKVIHLTLFAVLLITGRAARLRSGALIVALAGYAVVSEVLQAVLPLGRSGDVVDAAVDLLGIAVGVGVCGLGRRAALASSPP